MRRVIFQVACIVTLAAAGTMAADPPANWPRFRGPDAGVVADDAALPQSWSATQNVVWSLDVPGIGWGSPVVWGNHVFVTSAINSEKADPPKPGLYLGVSTPSTAPHRWIVYDIDFSSGKVRWAKEVKQLPPPQTKHDKNSFASETAVTDGELLYVYFGNVGLYAFDFSGNVAWSKEVVGLKYRNGWGSGSSPVLYKDRLYVLNDNDTQSYLAAYDKRTGKEIWRVDREEGTTWATPFVWENEKRTEIVTSGSDKVRSYDLDGKLLWEFTGMSTISIPTPFARHGLLYISSGYVGDKLRPAYAIRLGAAGDITLKEGETSNAFIAWSLPTGAAYNPTPLVYGDYYYTVHDRGFITCHDAKTGAEVYGRQRISSDATGFTSSPWAYNGLIFAMSEDGDTYVIKAGPEFKVLGKNSLNEMTLATPAVVRGSLFVRTMTKLYRIAGGGAAGQTAANPR